MHLSSQRLFVSRFTGLVPSSLVRKALEASWSTSQLVVEAEMDAGLCIAPYMFALKKRPKYIAIN